MDAASRTELCRKSKIANLDTEVVSQENVSELEITVDDIPTCGTGTCTVQEW
jgi:hypothetical protein